MNQILTRQLREMKKTLKGLGVRPTSGNFHVIDTQPTPPTHIPDNSDFMTIGTKSPHHFNPYTADTEKFDTLIDPQLPNLMENYDSGENSNLNERAEPKEAVKQKIRQFNNLHEESNMVKIESLEHQIQILQRAKNSVYIKGQNKSIRLEKHIYMLENDNRELFSKYVHKDKELKTEQIKLREFM